MTRITKAMVHREDRLLAGMQTTAPLAPSLHHDALSPMPLMRTDYARQCYCRWLAQEADRLMKEELSQ